MSNSALTFEQRVAVYAFEAAQDPINYRAMKTVVEMVAKRSIESRTVPRLNSPQKRGAVFATGITEAVLAVALAMRGPIAADTVLKKLESARFAFAAVDRAKTVSEALQRLAKAKKLVLVQKGRAGKASIYRAPRKAAEPKGEKE